MTERFAVDAAMRTDADGLLAAGDVCLAHNLSRRAGAAGRALGRRAGAGRVAGRTAAGAQAELGRRSRVLVDDRASAR